MELQRLIQRRFSGDYYSEGDYIQLIAQVVIVLAFALVAWRLIVMYNKRKLKNRKSSGYFNRSYGKKWRG